MNGHDAAAAMQIEHLPMLALPVAAAVAAFWRDRGRTSLPLLAAALATALAAAVHALVIPEHFGESALYGTFFVVLSVTEFAWSVVVVLSPRGWLLRAGAVGNAATVALWLFTRLVEVPVGPGAGETEAFGLLDILASVAEVGAVVAVVAVITRAGYVRPVVSRPSSVTQMA